MATIQLSENSLFGEIEAAQNYEKLATDWVSEDFQMSKGIAVNFK